MNRKEKLWGLIIFVLVFLGYLLPYTILSNVTKWYGSFLLWTILAVLIILANYFLTKDWSEEE
ncbi:hypothetical protein SAMN04487944_104101 [Gracilibacillus ureilyticus]|uniref:Uncharacterized protein n=1 Tax=Gracilibacillus ureilyticus TaxID=531814 RepID=A0A1H9P6Q5_9BACI|nr:hypothetical protein [Gracilibacillus ureilyticus]SER43263.1 hypothetical protein SAMN04487944_104101 [Gracilibacillus ureilyticus]